MNLLDWLNPGRWLLLIALAGALTLGAVTWKHNYDDNRRDEGRNEIRQAMTAAALRDHEAKAKEGLRRTAKQEENQRAQNAEIARLRDAAARNAAHADRVQRDYATAAHQWAERLADSPTVADVQAAGAAIAVCTDVRGRLDQAAGILASYAGAARSAGLKCAADYDALRPPE